MCVTCGGDDTCGGTCATGACEASYTCSFGTCVVDPASKWVITITKGSITADKWNTFSAPDGMVCIWIGALRYCTADSGNTLSPVWGCAFPPITAGTLMAGVDVEMFDNDRSGTGTCSEVVITAPGESICTKGTVPVTSANFKARAWGASCPEMSFSATLSPL